MCLQEVGWGSTDYIAVAECRARWRAVVDVVMNLWVPLNAGNFLTECGSVSCARRTLLHGVSLLVKYLSLDRQSSTYIVFKVKSTQKHNTITFFCVFLCGFDVDDLLVQLRHVASMHTFLMWIRKTN